VPERSTPLTVAAVALALTAMSGLARTVPGVRAQTSRALAPEVRPEGIPPVDADLESMQGGRVLLARERGRRVVVLFYEDRPHIEDNSVFKGEVQRFVVDNHLDDRVVCFGVANLGDVGATPRMLVRGLIRPIAERWGVDILLDWEGALRRPPFSFRTDAANVALIDREGRIAYRFTDTVDASARRAFFQALRRAIAPTR